MTKLAFPYMAKPEFAKSPILLLPIAKKLFPVNSLFKQMSYLGTIIFSMTNYHEHNTIPNGRRTNRPLPTHLSNQRSRLRYLVAVLAAMALLGSTAVAVTRSLIAQEVTSADATFTLTILHNNDGESHLVPDEDSGFPGVARFVAAMKELQAGSSSDGVITLTSGDNFLASKEFNVSLENGVPFFDSIALSGLYDAMALGNHDFDFRPGYSCRLHLRF